MALALSRKLASGSVQRRCIHVTRTASASAGLRASLQDGLDELARSGLLKAERELESAQGAHVSVATQPSDVLNMCSNNYLGLATEPDLVTAAKSAMDSHGYGLASVRFICGTQTLHKKLERDIAVAHRKQDATLFVSCFDANAALFETVLGPDDYVLSDALNHASIIDGIRLCKAKRIRYGHANVDDLAAKLREVDAERRASHAKRLPNILIATDSVFSMDGDIAPLADICQVAREYDAAVFVDECHGTGVLGETGAGVVEELGLEEHVDVVNSTFGKALGGAVGGFTTASSEICEMLRQRARPYLFSNTLPPHIVAANTKALQLCREGHHLRSRLARNASRFRQQMIDAGFDVSNGTHPIVPVMLGDAKLAMTFADLMLAEGVYVIGFCYPVVPKGAARIRVQLSAAHSDDDVDDAVQAFRKVGERLGVLARRAAM